ncbi:hypothetical protein ACXHXM_26925
MREYLRIPIRVEVVRADEIISASGERWDSVPHWAVECYGHGQMVVAETGVTLFNGSEALRAQPGDFVVRDHKGAFSVYDQTAFDQSFMPAHSAEVYKLHAA